MGLQYLKDVSTLELDADKCTGCGICTQVCGHAVFALNGGMIQITDRDNCMECGACTVNCPAEAVSVRPGVGCAWAIFAQWFRRSDDSCEEQIECDCS